MLRALPGWCFGRDGEDRPSTEGASSYLVRIRIRKRAAAVLRMKKWTRSKRMEASMLTVANDIHARECRGKRERELQSMTDWVQSGEVKTRHIVGQGLNVQC